MGIFDIFKKSTKPYKEPSTNLIYDLLFCDDINLYKSSNSQPEQYPWNILFEHDSTHADLAKLLTDVNIESRVKILIYNRLRNENQKIDNKELLGVVVELGLDNGLDVLASFKDGTARYINQIGKMVIWDAVDEISDTLTNHLFAMSNNVIKNIGPWDKPRRQYPGKGIVRITFLVSDGLYFGEGPINVLFDDPMAGPALASSAQLMKYLIEKTA